MRGLVFAQLIFISVASFVAGSSNEAGSPPRRRLKHRPATTRGWKNNRHNRELHFPEPKSPKSHHGNEAGRSGGGGGKGGGHHGHFHTNPARNVPTGTGTAIYNSAMGYTTTTSALSTFDNKCDAAAAGAEYRTSSYVPVYYQYEVLTNPNRNILQIADIIDKACQHFLAVWMVDCDTTTINTSINNGGQRHRNLLETQVVPKLHRSLQMTVAPIVGTGVGDWDTVLLGGTTAERCTSLVASAAMGQVCYKVIGSLFVYLDESMQATPNDVQTLAVETLTVGMNYGTTDFTELDQDIFQLRFIEAYGSAPEDLLEQNWSANQRQWGTSGNGGNMNPFASSEPSSAADSGRSGGAKFGIAFATLLCIAITVLLVVFVYKNRDRFCERKPSVKKQGKHFNLDDLTLASTKCDPKKDKLAMNEAESDGEIRLTIRGFAGSGSPESESVATRPLSPDPETPRHVPTDRSRMTEESNIVTPRSDWGSTRSTISEITETEPANSSFPVETPDDRIRIKLRRETILGSSRKQTRRSSELVSPERSYRIEDTVEL